MVPSLVFIIFREIRQEPTTVAAILERLPTTHSEGTIRKALRRLVDAGLIRHARRRDPRRGGPPRVLFYRPEGVEPSEHEIAAALRQAAPESRRERSPTSAAHVPPVVMLASPWRRDSRGNLTRVIRGVEAPDSLDRAMPGDATGSSP
jgi:hypothetical protein